MSERFLVDALAFELAKSGREDVGGDPRQCLGKLAEPLGSIEQTGHDLQRPAITDHGKCMGEVASATHAGMLLANQ